MTHCDDMCYNRLGLMCLLYQTLTAFPLTMLQENRGQMRRPWNLRRDDPIEDVGTTWTETCPAPVSLLDLLRREIHGRQRIQTIPAAFGQVSRVGCIFPSGHLKTPCQQAPYLIMVLVMNHGVMVANHCGLPAVYQPSFQSNMNPITSRF